MEVKEPLFEHIKKHDVLNYFTLVPELKWDDKNA